jgi:hypothetical protein
MATIRPPGGAGNDNSANYLRERGVLETTFFACGGEFGDPRDIATIATRLNRDPAKLGRDPNWATVEEILWFPLYGASMI